MHRVNIKPLSVNQAWQGRRYRTDTYKKWRNALVMMLPNIEVPDGYLELYVKYGFSSSNSDLDNPTKCFQDGLSERYGFNDKMISRVVLERDKVKRGEEYIEFEIKPFVG